jgi:hypothetical protein
MESQVEFVTYRCQSKRKLINNKKKKILFIFARKKQSDHILFSVLFFLNVFKRQKAGVAIKKRRKNK